MSIGTAEISPDALKVAKSQIIHAYKSIPRRGAEAGGLICGELHPKLRITSFVPVKIEYRFGPTYRFSLTDKTIFQKAIDEEKAAGRQVIGWYRSHTRQQTEGLTAEDRELTSLFFPGAESVFLLCFPDAEYNINGRFHLWTNGRNELVTSQALGRFSMLEEALESGEREEPVRETLRELARETAPARASEPEPAPAGPQRVARLRHVEPPIPVPVAAPAFTSVPAVVPGASPATRAGMVVLSLVLLAAAVFVFRSQFSALPDATVHANSMGLGMKVDRQGSALLMNWDRQSAAVLEATEATFTITQGTQIKVLKLSPGELHNGGILYTPHGDEDVQVELALHGPGGNFAQSLRIIQDRQTDAPVTGKKNAGSASRRQTEKQNP